MAEAKNQLTNNDLENTTQKRWCLFDGPEHHFQQYFSYIVAVSFIGEGNRMTRRKPPEYRKSLTNFIT